METETTTETTETVETTQAEPNGIFADGLTFRDGWANSIEDSSFDEFRSIAAQFKSMPEMLKSLKDSRTEFARRQEGMIKKPGPDATAEEKAAWSAALGVPESPDKYEIKVPEQLPEGVEFTAEELTAVRDFAHANGYTTDQVNALIEFQSKMAGAEIGRYTQEQRAAEEAGQQKLKDEWGMQFEKRSMLAQRAGKTFGIDAEMMKSPEMLRVMAAVGSAISEDKLASPSEIGGILSAGNEARDIVKNDSNPLYKAYWDPAHPDHEKAVQTVQAKYKEQSRREGN